MSKLIIEMEMPKDCPICPMAHYNNLCEFIGCEVAPNKRYAIKTDKAYAESDCRPDWCPIVEVLPEQHGEWEIYDSYKQTIDGRTFDGWCECSKCKTMYPYNFSTYNFCPNCGAKMDGEREE